MKFRTSLGQIHITTDHFGKMMGVWSISTSCLDNPFCTSRRKIANSICSHCYSAIMSSYRKSLRDVLSSNTKVLSSGLLSKKDANRIKFYSVFGRIEAFGDVPNVTCARNYLRIIRANPMTKFGVWTKNPGIWKQAIELEGGKKPRNASFVYSSVEMNKPAEKEKVEAFGYFDHVFTVYDKQFLSDYKNVISASDINCGARSCATCHRCYRQSRSLDYVNELLK